MVNHGSAESILYVHWLIIISFWTFDWLRPSNPTWWGGALCKRRVKSCLTRDPEQEGSSFSTGTVSPFSYFSYRKPSFASNTWENYWAGCRASIKDPGCIQKNCMLLTFKINVKFKSYGQGKQVEGEAGFDDDFKVICKQTTGRNVENQTESRCFFFLHEKFPVKRSQQPGEGTVILEHL